MRRMKYHVNPMGKGTLEVKREGASRADRLHEQKSDAVERARARGRSSKPSQIIIHGRDGKIQTEHSYGSDPLALHRRGLSPPIPTFPLAGGKGSSEP